MIEFGRQEPGKGTKLYLVIIKFSFTFLDAWRWVKSQTLPCEKEPWDPWGIRGAPWDLRGPPKDALGLPADPGTPRPL